MAHCVCKIKSYKTTLSALNCFTPQQSRRLIFFSLFPRICKHITRDNRYCFTELLLFLAHYVSRLAHSLSNRKCQFKPIVILRDLPANSSLLTRRYILLSIHRNSHGAVSWQKVEFLNENLATFINETRYSVGRTERLYAVDQCTDIYRTLHFAAIAVKTHSKSSRHIRGSQRARIVRRNGTVHGTNKIT